MAYFVTNEDGTKSIRPSPNVKVYMKLENPEETYNLFLNSIEQHKILEQDTIQKPHNEYSDKK